MSERVTDARLRELAAAQPDRMGGTLIDTGLLRELATEILAARITDDPTLDATDGAHPAWWRGHDHTAERMRDELAALYVGCRAAEVQLAAAEAAARGAAFREGEAANEAAMLRAQVDALTARVDVAEAEAARRTTELVAIGDALDVAGAGRPMTAAECVATIGAWVAAGVREAAEHAAECDRADRAEAECGRLRDVATAARAYLAADLDVTDAYDEVARTDALRALTTALDATRGGPRRATLIRKLALNDGWGEQRLYRCDPPMQFGEVPPSPFSEFVVTSQLVHRVDGPETLVFRANADGEIGSFVQGAGVRGALDHEAALRSAGYEVRE